MRTPPVPNMPRADRARSGRSVATMWSMKPYVHGLLRGEPAVVQRIGEDALDRSDRCPSAMRPSTVSRVWRRSSACTSTSTAEPPMPAEPWCIRMRACGRAKRLPGVPAESKNCPALQAKPRARVETSHGTSRITSRIASIDGTEPPGECIHSAMSWSTLVARRASGAASRARSRCRRRVRHRGRGPACGTGVSRSC